MKKFIVVAIIVGLFVSLQFAFWGIINSFSSAVGYAGDLQSADSPIVYIMQSLFIFLIAASCFSIFSRTKALPVTALVYLLLLFDGSFFDSRSLVYVQPVFFFVFITPLLIALLAHYLSRKSNPLFIKRVLLSIAIAWSAVICCYIYSAFLTTLSEQDLPAPAPLPQKLYTPGNF